MNVDVYESTPSEAELVGICIYVGELLVSGCHAPPLRLGPQSGPAVSSLGAPGLPSIDAAAHASAA